ncbi:MAG: lysylphosphatidylglycerol synthase transmembrane domain-containing protein [Bacteroidia bacterium]
MSPKVKSILQLVIFSAIGAGLIWLSIHNIPDSERETTKQSFKKADYFVVFISAVISILAHVVRAWRWNSMLQPLGHSISFKNSFAAVMIGYVVNFAIPRGGELSRCGVATQYEKVPFPAALGTVITERIVDLLIMLLLFFITLAVQFSELTGLTHQYVLDPLSKKLSGDKTLLYIFIGGMILLAAAIFVFRKKIKAMLTGKLGSMIKNFGDGLKSVKDVKSPMLFIVQSLLIWFCYFLSLYVCFWCFDETKTLGIKPALSVLLFGTVGVAISPGGIGAYQLISTQVLLFYGVINSISISFPWIVWGSGFIAIIVVGALCFLLLPILNRNKDGVPQNS